MSLTNPNTPVSQQDLKDLYEQKILPYLGGAFGLVATGIDSANLYSTTERVVGQWIDGKPLYQKTVETVSPNTTKATQKIVQLDAECRIQNFFGIIGESTSGSVVKKPLNYGNPELGFYMHTYSPYGNDLWMYVTRSAEVNAPVWVTVQYTKTTDSAVESYGTDTTYSTDEHVVGSWIDGKPLYQKTITGTAPASSATQNIQIGANVENVLVIGGYCQHDSFLTPINAQVDTNEYLMVWVRNNSHPTVPNTLGIKAGSALYGGSYNIMLQYTKPSST